ncbi:unnamed protein product [Haemonchus placei]|uniref:Cytoplasmic protein n=1 Tax=Haemonchus placei TaxID=6290 RepID=A0A0N4X0S2_HAEPC|nr:unnamed protein product [Haemonchus placei]
MKTGGEGGYTGKPMTCDSRVEIFRDLRKVTEEKDQQLIFLQEVGNSYYELLESLLQGRELEDVELKELRQVIERHYQPKKRLAQRFGLMSEVQKPG